MLSLNYLVFMPYGFMFFIMTMFGTIYSLSASHWLGVWAGLEINLIAFIPLMVYRGTVLETESAIKYFIFQAVGSAMIMFSSLLSFGTNFVWDLSSSGMSLLIGKGIVILMLGLLLKLGAFPLHFWFPGVSAGLSWLSNLLLFTWQKLAPLFLLFSVFCLWNSSFVSVMIMVLASGSSIIGGVGGINQTQLRALLAYSSIAHMGWMIFCCCLSESSMKIYFLIYFFITFCIFLGMWQSEMNLIFQAFSSFLGKNLMLRFFIIILLLSLGGIPPLLGFVPKWVVLSLASSTDMVFILIFLILGSLMSLFYYLSLMFSAFFSSGPFLMSEIYMSTKSKKSFLVNILVLGMFMNLLGGLFLMGNLYSMDYL
nr:TPA_asm: NADH dehydrogenase subunit 2 [Symmetromphalus regularis]